MQSKTTAPTITHRGRKYSATAPQSFTIGEFFRLQELTICPAGDDEASKRDERVLEQEFWAILAPEFPYDLYSAATLEEKGLLVDQASTIITDGWTFLERASALMAKAPERLHEVLGSN